MDKDLIGTFPQCSNIHSNRKGYDKNDSDH